jgi:hypothetical protein
MKPRRNEALVLIFLIASSTFTDAREIPTKRQQSHLEVIKFGVARSKKM